jgi:prepilin-type N-terminal cleavage/methylation domain-containing protein
MNRLRNKEQGFTLIEVVIVLAIAAGLILVVLLAVGGAQRSNRDTQRKSMVGNLASALENFASNTGGAYPTATLPASYTTNMIDPTTGAAPVYSTATATLAAPSNYASGQICGAAGAMTTTAATARNYAISFWSETANAAQCRDNK